MICIRPWNNCECNNLYCFQSLDCAIISLVVAFITFYLEGIIVTISAQQIPFNLLSGHYTLHDCFLVQTKRLKPEQAETDTDSGQQVVVGRRL